MTNTTAPPVELLAAVRQLVISGRAREIRVTARVSLSEMAAVIDVDPSTVARWEAADRMPRGQAALRYLEQLENLHRSGTA